MNTLAVINGEDVVQNALLIVVIGVVFWLLHWLIGYVAVPEPFNKVARIILAVAAVLILISVLLSMIGHPIVAWPR